MMLLITGDAEWPDIDADGLQDTSVLHKPVTPVRLVRTLTALWQRRDSSGDTAGAKDSLVPDPILSATGQQL